MKRQCTVADRPQTQGIDQSLEIATQKQKTAKQAGRFFGP
jgi:hypothetical protein